jgi:hypothetical protein
MVGAVVILCAIVISVRSRRPDPDAASATGVS